VIQFSASTLPPGADLAAAFDQASKVADLNSGCLFVMKRSDALVKWRLKTGVFGRLSLH
jgi:hypothetical protein